MFGWVLNHASVPCFVRQLRVYHTLIISIVLIMNTYLVCFILHYGLTLQGLVFIKWSNTHQKPCSKCCKIFNECLTILLTPSAIEITFTKKISRVLFYFHNSFKKMEASGGYRIRNIMYFVKTTRGNQHIKTSLRDISK